VPSSRERTLWSRVLRPGAGGPCEHLHHDAGFQAFLADRLRAEHQAATDRPLGPNREPGMHERGLRLLEDLLDDLLHGELPDETSLQILLTAYSAHPDFRPEWLPGSLPTRA
jgi:hypothetical protein